MPSVMNRLHDDELDRLFAKKLGNLKAEPPENTWKKIAAGITVTTATSTIAFSSIIKYVIWSLYTITTFSLLTISSPSSTKINKSFQNNSQNSTVVYCENQKMPNLYSINEIPVNLNTDIHIPYRNNILLVTHAETEHDLTEVSNLKNTEQDSIEFNVLNTIASSQLEMPETDFVLPKSFLSDVNFSQTEIIPLWLELNSQTGIDIMDFGIQNNNRVLSMATNAGIELAFHFSDFYLSTGINSISLFKQNNYNYAIKEYKPIGEYTMVDSMSFIPSIDSGGNSYFIPQFYTSTHLAYDSVNIYYTTKNQDKYQYLEIPFSIGVQKDFNKFSVFAQSGFTYSFLINHSEKTSDDYYNENNSYPLFWQNQSLSYNNNFWSFMLAAGISYNVNAKLSLGIQPTYRYYISPFSAEINQIAKSPVSYGLRFKLSYKFPY